MIPLEIFTLVGNLALGAYLKMKHQEAQARHQHLKDLVMMNDSNVKSQNEARKFVPDGGKMTRRIIVVSVIIAVFMAPTLAPLLFPDIPVNYLYSESSGWAFSYEKIKVITMSGITILPVATHSATAIIGFYFGSRIGK